jgi:GT2 family glycosyltransferase
LDGWDDTYSRGAEDVDFSWRAQLKGYRLSFAPRAVVRYRMRSRHADLIQQYRDYGKMHALLAHRYKACGLPRTSLDAWLRWLWLTFHTPELVSNRRQRRWLATLGFNLGWRTARSELARIDPPSG